MSSHDLGSKDAPIHVFLRYEETRLVQELRSQISALTAKVDELDRELKHTQFRYGCEVTLCNELIDLCRQYKVPYRKSLDRWQKDTRRK